jgi:hypothetical protein
MEYPRLLLEMNGYIRSKQYGLLRQHQPLRAHHNREFYRFLKKRSHQHRHRRKRLLPLQNPRTLLFLKCQRLCRL